MIQVAPLSHVESDQWRIGMGIIRIVCLIFGHRWGAERYSSEYSCAKTRECKLCKQADSFYAPHDYGDTTACRRCGNTIDDLPQNSKGLWSNTEPEDPWDSSTGHSCYGCGREGTQSQGNGRYLCKQCENNPYM